MINLNQTEKLLFQNIHIRIKNNKSLTKNQIKLIYKINLYDFIIIKIRNYIIDDIDIGFMPCKKIVDDYDFYKNMMSLSKVKISKILPYIIPKLIKINDLKMLNILACFIMQE